MSEPATRGSDVFVEVTAELLRRGCAVRFRADGQSMHPAIRNGDAITVAPTPPAEVRAGDILLCRQRRRVVAHRVVSITRGDHGESALVLCGDARASDATPVASTQVLGKVIAVDRQRRTLGPGRRARALLRALRIAASRVERLLLPTGLRARG